MHKITLDPALRAKLNNLDSEVEVCDEAGNIVGYFLPAGRHRDELYAWAKAQFTDEEIEQARKEPGGRSLAEILARLENT